MSRPSLSSCLLLAAGLALPFLATSCRTPDTPENKARAAAVLNPRRQASLLPWQGKTIQGDTPANYASIRTAAVIPPGQERKTSVRILPGNHFVMETTWLVKGDFSAGSAVPVTADGYYLTAAHCVSWSNNLELLTLTTGNELKNVPVRIVWQGNPEKGGPDLALLHAPVRPAAHAVPAPAHRLVKGRLVLTSGFGSKGLPNLEQGTSGGVLRRVGKLQTSSGRNSAGDGPDMPVARWREVSHSAPLAPADSGGPVFDEEGTLLGFNTAMTAWVFLPFGLHQIWNYQGLATSPDPDWIQALIRQDRDRRRHRR